MGLLVVNSDPERLWGKPLEPTREELTQMYLTFEALEDCTLTLTIPSQITPNNLTSVSYSIDDGETWITTENKNTSVAIQVSDIKEGDKILWKGTGVRYSGNSGGAVNSVFSSTGDFNIYGNIMSLLYNDDFALVDEFENWPQYIFKGLFKNFSVVNAKRLILPVITSVDGCYYQMFSGCTKLIVGPDLLSTTLYSKCYSGMFSGCTSLNYIKMLATTINESNCFSFWTQNVSPTGTFVKAAGVEIPSGTSGIPSGWTVEEV